MKVCTRCNIEKPLGDFYLRGGSAERRRSACIDCVGLAINTKRRRKVYTPAEKTALKESSRRADRKSRYGITDEDFQYLEARQGGVCGICNRPERRERNGKPFALAVDHDHDTGEVRGLLCSNCNIAVGMLDDSPALLQAAIQYLENAQRAFRIDTYLVDGQVVIEGPWNGTA